MIKISITLVCYEIFEHQLAWRIINDALIKIIPAEVIILSDQKPEVSGARWVEVESNTPRMAAHRALWYDIPNLTDTSHFLNLEWDAGLLHPEVWDDRYLQYDYVGAPWWNYPPPRVGNGGFSLRSTRMMRYVSNNLPLTTPEDTVLCRGYRPQLEAQGFVWAPDNPACYFSYESYLPDCKTFGYHHIYNWPNLYDDEEIRTRISLMSPYALSKPSTKVFMRMWRGKQKAASVQIPDSSSGFWPWFRDIAPNLEPRLNTFTAMFEYLDSLPDPVTILETGCARHPEWREGLSTVLFGHYAKHRPGSRVVSVDNNPASIGFASTLVKNLPVELTCEDSVNYLSKQHHRKIDLLYLDSFDASPSVYEQSAQHHLRELYAILPALNYKTLVVVDDTPKIQDKVVGKGTYIADYAMRADAKQLFHEFQIGWINMVRERPNAI